MDRRPARRRWAGRVAALAVVVAPSLLPDLAGARSASPPTDADRRLLAASDLALAAPESFRMHLRLTPLAAPERTTEAEVWRAGAATAVELLGERDRGKRFLQRPDGFWFVAPGAQPVKLGPSHRLAGGVALQEILAPSYSRDYRLESVRREPAGATELVTFELVGEAAELAWRRVRYVVRADRSRPVRIELLTPSGRLARLVELAEWAAPTGLELRRLVVKDLLRGGAAVTIEVLAMEPREVPPERFELPR
jgi:hypothetical protein